MHNNNYDSLTIQIIVHVKPIHCKTLIGYIIKEVDFDMLKVTKDDQGIIWVAIK